MAESRPLPGRHGVAKVRVAGPGYWDRFKYKLFGQSSFNRADYCDRQYLPPAVFPSSRQYEKISSQSIPLVGRDEAGEEPQSEATHSITTLPPLVPVDPFERAALEKQLIYKLDRSLMPILFCMIILK